MGEKSGGVPSDGCVHEFQEVPGFGEVRDEFLRHASPFSAAIREVIELRARVIDLQARTEEGPVLENWELPF